MIQFEPKFKYLHIVDGVNHYRDKRETGHWPHKKDQEFSQHVQHETRFTLV